MLWSRSKGLRKTFITNLSRIVNVQKGHFEAAKTRAGTCLKRRRRCRLFQQKSPTSNPDNPAANR